eukprot:GEMP01075897.1.p1 GENE.GEMP01075897.1~~GEMP01075897.1.p1  ORF type:complete len:117 (+),score=25.06 GEMP01075897.1:220-570(+)
MFISSVQRLFSTCSTQLCSTRDGAGAPTAISTEEDNDDGVDGSFYVQIRTVTGQAMVVPVDIECRVHDLKCLVEKDMDIAAEEQRLLSGSRELKDEETMKDCGVQKGVVLMLLRRV